ncbi:hypothetical protein Skr01_73190 [Sphaerisporangium krabiense]|uniref:Soluble lytic murein transglycosylase-like protein n=1 Tax=Sphaerisporangium krabiense TaxID=763782 RepID=A0A7W8Z8R5_9ACTN|nr:transglycosylase SLT domain-containing protein [Sphaerisporangium krabiense]MBB5629577.1 soluble lytic murein transglycosylase-like protein [Sphaerisporangium krabiense]GII67234.1 hypothetical protein Skr01_73190 [Sphaerisporangium krabiense]
MRRRWIGGLALAVLVSGCGATTAAPREPAPAPPAASPAPSASAADESGDAGSEGSAGTATSPVRPSASTEALDAPPAPDAAIPTSPDRLAKAVVTTEAALKRAIDDWRGDDGKAGGEPPEAVVLWSLHQQRLYRVLGHDAGLTRRTLARLPAAVADRARDNAEAARDLFDLTRPTSTPGRFRTQEPPRAEDLRGYMRGAERRFGVDWEVLAAVMLVETKFGRLRSPSSAGAQGPMQFMPATWKAYGLGGDVHDPRDAVTGAANYLRASGAPGDYRRALYAYNHDRRYVDAVQRYARQIRRDARAYYAYHSWQVFVLTTKGDLRLTGP